MKSASAILALALAGSAIAQNFSGEPACATSCLSYAITAAGCALTDMDCQCGPTQTLISSYAAPCLIQSAGCGVSELLQAQSVGLALCTDYSKTKAATVSATTTGTSTTGTTTTGSTKSTSTPTTTSTSTSTSTTSSSSTSSTTSASTAAAATTTSSSTSTNGAATMGAAGALAAVVGLVAAAL